MSLESIRARVEAATPGPWVEKGRDSWHDRCLAEGQNPGDSIGLGCDVVGPPEAWHRGQFDRHADAAFIAHARTDIPALLAVAEAAKAVEASTVCAHDHDASDCPWPALARALEALEAQP